MGLDLDSVACQLCDLIQSTFSFLTENRGNNTDFIG